ncbi:MFS transporter [Chloroflexota bacterium]
MKKAINEYQDIDTRVEVDRDGKGGFSPRKLRIFNSLKNPVYRLYYGGMLGQVAAMNMQIMARSLLIYRLTGSAAILGGISLAFAFPLLLVALFGGAIADRVQKKYVLLAGQLSLAIVSVGIALSLTLGYLSAEQSGSWWLLIFASILQGIIMGLMMPSRQAIIGEIVSAEQVMNAVSLDVLGKNTLRFLAPAVTGFLIETFDFAAVYFAMTSMYLVAVVFFSFMPLTGTMTTQSRGTLTDIKEGFKYIRRETTILLILLFTIFAIVLSLPYIPMMSIFAEDVLKVGASGMGILLSLSGIGAMLGSITLASLPNKKRGAMLVISSLFLSLALIGFSFSHSWYLSLSLIILVGLGQAGLMTLGSTLLQYYVESDYRGRVMSVYMMEPGMMSIGAFSAGLIAEAIGVQWAIGGFATVLALLCILTLIFVPQLRKLD